MLAIRRSISLAVLLLLAATTACPGQTAGEPKSPAIVPAVAPLEPPAEKTPRPPIYNESADAAKDIAAALAAAKRDHSRVLLVWGANWCGWCHILSDGFKSDAAVSKQLSYEYVVVKVDIAKFDKNLELAAKYGANFKEKGAPYLTVLDEDGEVVANEDTAQLEEGPKHDPAKVLALLKKHEAPRTDAAAALAAAKARAKAENKVLFVHFGAPWCGWCHRLEDWMARPEIAAILSKHFVDAKIDQDRFTGAKEVQSSLKMPEQSGIPWFAFLDADGKEIANSTGPKGNTGFPAADHEIAHFVTMLKSAKLSDADVAVLEKSLVDLKPADH